MKTLTRAAGILVAIIALGAMAWGSRAPLRIADDTAAIIRVSLGARPERIEKCRAVTDDELAKVLPQMRQRLVCEGTTARYRLEIRRDSAVLLSRVVRGGGLRHDRQLYVFHEITVPPGVATLHASLTRIDTATTAAEEPSDTTERGDSGDIMADRARREVQERRRRREEAVPAELRLSETVELSPTQVLLVTYEQEGRRLVFRR